MKSTSKEINKTEIGSLCLKKNLTNILTGMMLIQSQIKHGINRLEAEEGGLWNQLT
jgi:hypothetical protein